MTVYFDNAATTQPRAEAIDAMLHTLRTAYGNPSSAHFMGRDASHELETARKNIADALGASPDEIFFTSGGTEADNWAILGSAGVLSRRGRHIITSAIEHDAVMSPIKKLENDGWDVTRLAPDSSGCISAGSFAAALREDTVFVSVMLVNNETGAINPVGEYHNEIKRRGSGAVLHTDAVQGFCKLPFTVKSLGADLLTVSAHKIHGPKGAGALFVKKGTKLTPQFSGGKQERSMRAGTEAVPAIKAFGEAARLGAAEREEISISAGKLREYICEQLFEELPEAVIIGDGGSPFILNLSLPGYRSEVLMTFLEGEGICVSKSAACKKGARSRVLEAMRLPNNIIDGAIRISFSRYNTIGEAGYFVKTLKKASVKILRG